MTRTIELGDISIQVTQKPIKHVHLSVYPPMGRVTMTAPVATRPEVARAYAISKLRWIREQREKLRRQARESQRQYVERETHWLWGHRHLLTVEHRDVRPFVRVDRRRLILTVRPGATREKREEVFQEWYRSLLHTALPDLIGKWEKKLRVRLDGYSLQRMKTKWGTCNHRARTIRLNSELAKKPKDLLDYVVAHEMAHLVEPSHNEDFHALMDKHYPSWREARLELNELPLAAEAWSC
jgi:predicted metal-dependent hydrolase